MFQDTEILSDIPTSEELFVCENLSVNAVSIYYLGIAKKSNINVDIKLDIPEKTGVIQSEDLCVIIGNLLENAIEACSKMVSSNKFIRVRSEIYGTSLSVCVANSFDGLWREKDDIYLSRKDTDFTVADDNTVFREGTGISSIIAICDKYEGASDISIKGNVWTASAVVVME